MQLVTTECALNGCSMMSLSQSSISSDICRLPAKRSRSQACVICSGRGHGKNQCPKLTLYGPMPLQDGDMEIRQKLGNNMMDVEHFKTLTRDEFDDREVMDFFPKFCLPTLIIHKRYLIQANVVKNKSSNKMCLTIEFRAG